MAPSYPPPGETASDLWNERSILAGLFLGAVGFGVHLVLFIQCFQMLRHDRSNRQSRYFLVYIVIVFILGNIGNGTNIKFGEMVFIDNRNYPGGPNAYFVEQSTNPVAVICNSVYIVNSWLQDGLMVYRFWVIWSHNIYVVIISCIMYLAAVVLSSILIAELSQPEKTIWTKISINLAIPYWSISIAMTILITCFITARLLWMRRRVRNCLNEGSLQTYVSISAMLIESAIIYSSNGLLFVISYGINSPVQNLALPLLGQTQSIAPLLIIFRVAQGRAWTSSTAQALTTTLEFRSTQLDTSVTVLKSGHREGESSNSVPLVNFSRKPSNIDSIIIGDGASDSVSGFQVRE